MQNIFTSEKKLSKLLLMLAAFPLVLALASQYIFGLHPCELCIYQRIPYAVATVFAVLAMWKYRSMRVFITSAIIITHAFLITSGIGFFHVGVEKNWWKSGDCTSSLDMSSPETIRQSLLTAPVVKCSDIQFEFLGVSMAGWNFIYGLSAAIFTIYALTRYFKIKKGQPIYD